jgi:hypothetical protein
VGEAFRGVIEVADKASLHENALLDLVQRALSTSMVYVRESIDSLDRQLSETGDELSRKLSELENRIRLLEEQDRFPIRRQEQMH